MMLKSQKEEFLQWVQENKSGERRVVLIANREDSDDRALYAQYIKGEEKVIIARGTLRRFLSPAVSRPNSWALPRH